MVKRTHVVVVIFPDDHGADRFTSKRHSLTQCETIAAGIRANGFPGRGKPDSVRVVPMACDALTAIRMGAL